jgi:hypothetical protein
LLLNCLCFNIKKAASSIVMAFLAALVAGLLVVAESQASDKFITANLGVNAVSNMGDKSLTILHDALGPVHPAAQAQNSMGFRAAREEFLTSNKDFGLPKTAGKEENQSMQKLIANNMKGTRITLSAIGVGFLAVAAMLGVRIRRGVKPATVVASSGTPSDSVMEMKAQGADINVAATLETRDTGKETSRRFGWGQVSPQNSGARTLCYATDQDQEEAEIMADAENIAKKKRSNLYNENGVAYAPWMVRQVDEDAVADARAKRQYEKRLERVALEEKQGTVNILEAASSELTGMGLRATPLSEEEVELVWSTNDEEANKGFIVERKSVGSASWEEIATYTSWSPLKSKGTLGGSYKYLDSTASEGEFLYRIVAEQVDNSRAIVCQVGVTVENASAQLQTKIVVGFFAFLGVAAIAAGALLDPIKG